MREYRSSSLGSCTKSQIALQLGYSPLVTPDRMEDLYARGNDHETECLAAMRADGWVIVDEQRETRLEVAGAVVTGHLDGIASGEHNGPDRVLEIKSPFSFHKWEKAHRTGDYSDPLMNRYGWQISSYLASTGLEAVVACVEDGQVRTFGIEVAPVSLEDIEFLVGWMEGHVKEGILPGVCSQADYPCPVAYLHEKAELEEDEDLDYLTTRYDDIVRQEKSVKALKDEVREEIVKYLGEREAVESSYSKVTRFTTTRKSYDYDAMERDGIDLAKYVTEKESESVRITKKEGGQS